VKDPRTLALVAAASVLLANVQSPAAAHQPSSQGTPAPQSSSSPQPGTPGATTPGSTMGSSPAPQASAGAPNASSGAQSATGSPQGRTGPGSSQQTQGTQGTSAASGVPNATGAQPGSSGATGAPNATGAPQGGTQPGGSTNGAGSQGATGTPNGTMGTQGSGSQSGTPNATTGGGGTASQSGGGVDSATGLPPPPQPPVLPAVPNVAPGYTAPEQATLPSGQLIGVNQTPFVGITLDDAIAMALQRNTDLALAQANQVVAGYQIVEARGAYDIKFQLQPTFNHTVSAPVSAFQTGPGGGAYTTDTLGATAGISGLTQNGGNYSLTASGQRTTSNLEVNSFNPYYNTQIALTFTQPLLRGEAIDATRRQLQLAVANRSAQRDQSLVTASQTVVNVANAYWDLVAAWQNVGIQEEGLRQAAAQAASNTRLAQRGQAAPVDVVESNTQVNVFQDNVFSALQNVNSLQTQIKSLILSNPADPIWFANLVPTSNVGQLPPEPTLASVVAQAVQNRAEFAQLRDSRVNADIQLAYAKDQTKPQLDVSAQIAENGFAGNLIPLGQTTFGAFLPVFQALNINPSVLGTTPPYIVGGPGTSAKNAFTAKFPSYQIGATLSFPIGNHTAKAALAAANEQERVVETQQIALGQRVQLESINALQSLRSARYRLAAAHAARVAAERVLLAEQRRFSIGTSTTFLVLQRQLDVANDRGRELQAQTDLNKAVVELSRVTGSIFSQNKVDPSVVGSQTLALPNVQNPPAPGASPFAIPTYPAVRP
jgi:HAE1 family hydrophobic/amphiphilic exporter-1